MTSQAQLDRIETMLNEVIALLRGKASETPENAPISKKSITMVKRGVTQNSGSPMWRCVADDGSQVNVFMHNDPMKNNFNLIEDAGYGAEFIEIDIDDSRTYFRYPIAVTVKRDGKWWSLVGVEQKPEGSRADIAELDSIKSVLDEEPF